MKFIENLIMRYQSEFIKKLPDFNDNNFYEIVGIIDYISSQSINFGKNIYYSRFGHHT